MNVLDLFSGIGGFSLGLERAGMRTVAFCERDEFCRAVLRKHWPAVPCFDDIHTLDAERLGGLDRIDVISGGFPCQPFSVAGKQRAQDDDRHLWPQMRRVIALARPAWVVGENVTGLIPLALDDVLFDLESLGYSSRAFVIPACAVDAKHRRNRVWIVAKDAATRDRDRDRKSACAVDDEASGLCGVVADADESRDAGWRIEQPEGGESSRDDGHADSQGLPSSRQKQIGEDRQQGGRMPSAASRWSVEPDVGRVAHGVPRRVDRLRALGNAVVPQVVEEIGRAIMRCA